jgi:hypothetical protein
MHESDTRPATGPLAEGARSVKEQAGVKARQLADQAESAADKGKQRLASRLGDVAQAFHRTGEELRSEQKDGLSDFTDAVATRIERVASYLEGGDVRSMAAEVESFARRQPALFLGGAFTLGLVAARFLKSSSRHGAELEPEQSSNWRDDPIGGYSDAWGG